MSVGQVPGSIEEVSTPPLSRAGAKEVTDVGSSAPGMITHHISEVHRWLAGNGAGTSSAGTRGTVGLPSARTAPCRRPLAVVAQRHFVAELPDHLSIEFSDLTQPYAGAPEVAVGDVLRADGPSGTTATRYPRLRSTTA
jgi:hypothetical protein